MGMRAIVITEFLFVLVLGSVSMPTAAAEKLRVLDQGLDGNQRVYRVTCPNGGLASVIETFDLGGQQALPAPDNTIRAANGRRAILPRVISVCSYPSQGEEVCRPDWPIDEAAAAVCMTP